MSAWRSVLGISHGITVPMTNYSDPIQLLVTELDTLSATSIGRRVLRRVEMEHIDTHGCATLKEFARQLEWDPRKEARCHPTLLALVPLAPNDREIALVIMVALRRPFRDMWFSLTRVTGDLDVGGELLVELWSALTRIQQASDLENLMESVYQATRRKVRRSQRQQGQLESIGALDFIDDDPIAQCVGDNLLDQLVHRELMGSDDAELIRLTRVEGVPLVELAKSLHVSYDSLRMRRQRIERVIASRLNENRELP